MQPTAAAASRGDRVSPVENTACNNLAILSNRVNLSQTLSPGGKIMYYSWDRDLVMIIIMMIIIIKIILLIIIIIIIVVIKITITIIVIFNVV